MWVPNRNIRNKELGKGFLATFNDPPYNKPARTISARYYKDGAECLIRYEDGAIRKLTEQEISRLQTFPDTYIFKGSKKDIYIQLGNAVPCLLAKALAEQVIYYLDNYDNLPINNNNNNKEDNYCQEVYKSGKHKGERCKHKAKFNINNKLLCGIHCKNKIK